MFWVLIGRVLLSAHNIRFGCKIRILFCYTLLTKGLLFACWVIFHAFLSSADFLQNWYMVVFWKNLFRNAISVSNSLDPDWAFVGPDLGLICLQRLSADGKSPQKEIIHKNSWLLFLHSLECSKVRYYMGLVVRKPVFGFANNKGADQPAHQHLCYSLIGNYDIKTCFKWNCTILASLCSWASRVFFFGNYNLWPLDIYNGLFQTRIH